MICHGRIESDASIVICHAGDAAVFSSWMRLSTFPEDGFEHERLANASVREALAIDFAGVALLSHPASHRGRRGRQKMKRGEHQPEHEWQP